VGDRFACARDIRRQVSGLSKSEGGDHDHHRTHPRIAGRVERQRSPVCAKTDPNSPKVICLGLWKGKSCLIEQRKSSKH
jgi:hypothetical protein